MGHRAREIARLRVRRVESVERRLRVGRTLVERIGDTMGLIKHAYGDAVTEEELPVPDHTVGMREVLRLFDTKGPSLADANVVAVGHRIVQGGRYFDGPALITDEVRNLIEELCPLAPLHNPAHLKGIDVARELMPDVPHVAVFDTAFFQQLPDRSALYALETETAEKYSVRRYGAHGTSHQFVSQEIAKLEGRDDLKQIVLHLGNGASVSAVKNGKPIDTSMGLTPLEGLMMGTRTGDIDPAVVFHLQRVAGIGENDAAVRRELAEALAPFGVKIDVEANNVRSGEPRVISAPDSTVTIYVFPTNEELAIARQALTFA